jgi:protein tyrosine/serine phosphatase
MTPAAAAAEYRSNIGPDFSLADAYDAEYLDAEAEDETAARQALNARMADWYGIG